jgi:tetratricopeptide (TPR) repeat protein
VALTSLATSLAKDTAGAFTKDARQAFDYLSKTFYNDAAKALNEGAIDRATQLYAKYKETTAQLDPAHDFKVRDIEFGNALGTVFTKRYNQDRLDTTWFDKAIRAYQGVLAIDAENYGANYNLATLYYNRGVYNIQRITPENDIPGIQDIQRVSRALFSEALPFMLKAHQMNPKRKETLLGLEGIYYSLQNNEESEKYRKLYEELEPEEDH